MFDLFLALASTPLSNPRREIVLETTREAKAVHSCTLQLPARVSPPSSAFSGSSAVKSQSNFLRMQPRENAAHHSHHPVYREKRSALRPAHLPDFQQVISRFRSVLVSHNFLPPVYSSHATYTRHFRSNVAARGLGFWVQGLGQRAMLARVCSCPFL